MTNFLTGVVIAIAASGVVTLVLGGDAANASAVVMLVLLVATPLVRVGWLVLRWFRRGDTRYALVGVVVLLIPLAGFLLTL